MKLVRFDTADGGHAYVNPKYVLAIRQTHTGTLVMLMGNHAYHIDTPAEDVIRALRAFDETEAWDT
jgi:hypothetical protein